MGKLSDVSRKSSKTPTHIKFFRVLSPFFTKSNVDRKKSWMWVSLMLILLVLESWFLVAFSYTQVKKDTLSSCLGLSANCCGCTVGENVDATAYRGL